MTDTRKRGVESFAGRAYHMRQLAGPFETWLDIAKRLGYRPDLNPEARADRLLSQARKFALRRNLDWPPKRYDPMVVAEAKRKAAATQSEDAA